jgi:hypothetical protein
MGDGHMFRLTCASITQILSDQFIISLGKASVNRPVRVCYWLLKANHPGVQVAGWPKDTRTFYCVPAQLSTSAPKEEEEVE